MPTTKKKPKKKTPSLGTGLAGQAQTALGKKRQSRFDQISTIGKHKKKKKP